MKLTLLLICDLSDESRNFYNDVQTASTSEEFSNLKSQSVSAVYDYRSEGTGQTTAASSYKVITLTCITQTHIQILAPNKGVGWVPIKGLQVSDWATTFCNSINCLLQCYNWMEFLLYSEQSRCVSLNFSKYSGYHKK